MEFFVAVLFGFCLSVEVESLPVRDQFFFDQENDFRNVLKVQPQIQVVLKRNLDSHENDKDDKQLNRLGELKCETCILLVNYEFTKEQSLGRKSSSVEDMVRWVAAKCELLGLESPRVCKGALETFGGEVAQVLKKVKLTAEEICGITMPDACTNYKSHNNHNTDWTIELPPKPIRKVGNKQNFSHSANLKVLHLSDVHIDTKYSVGSVANCNEPLCCHLDDVIGDDIIEPLDPERPSDVRSPVTRQRAGKWGDYNFCDLPMWTFENMMKHIQTHNVHYVIWTGDIPAHDVWSQSRRHQRDMLFNMTSKLIEYLPFVPIYPAVGNHDSFPSNNFPPSKVRAGGKYSVEWFYEALAQAWAPWLDEEALSTVKLGGFYTTLVRPAHRIISLNTNFCYNENWWMWMNPDDPSDMLKWFVAVLTKAEVNNEKVHVIGHVPPGVSPDCHESWSRNYFRIVDRFQMTITGQFFGHTHFDEVLLYYDTEGRAGSVAYLGPSATPYAWLNPAYRIYEVGGFGTGWSVLNHQTYSLDLDQANKHGPVEWSIEYDACKAYGIDKLDPVAWDKMLREWLAYVEDNTQTKPKSLENYISFFIRNRGASILKQMNELRCSTIPQCVKAVVCRIAKNIDFHICRDVI